MICLDSWFDYIQFIATFEALHIIFMKKNKVKFTVFSVNYVFTAHQRPNIKTFNHRKVYGCDGIRYSDFSFIQAATWSIIRVYLSRRFGKNVIKTIISLIYTIQLLYSLPIFHSLFVCCLLMFILEIRMASFLYCVFFSIYNFFRWKFY